MSLSAAAIFDIVAPNYSGDADKTDILSLAALRTSSTIFGDKYNTAVALRAAHIITMRDRNGVGGAVSGQKEGDLSISFANPSGNAMLGLTSYGQQLQQLIRECSPGVSISGTIPFDYFG